jgi:hypothetical protein
MPTARCSMSTARQPDERFRTIETQSSTERAAWSGLASAGLD